MKKKSSSQVVIVSDTHCGSAIGLCPPAVKLDDGGTHNSSEMQAAAWDYWSKSFWPEVHKRAKNRETVVVLNGDLVDGNHHGTAQIWTTDPLQQIKVAVSIFKPIADRYPVFVTRGTPAHVMASGAADEQIAKEICARQLSTERDSRSSYLLRLEVGGVLFNVAHHGPGPGNRIHTHGNALRGFVRDIVLQALLAHAKPPDVVVRSHVHYYTHEINNEYGHMCHAIITPAWQWQTEFAHRILSHEDISDVGGVIVSIDNGHVSNVECLKLSLSQSDTVRFS